MEFEFKNKRKGTIHDLPIGDWSEVGVGEIWLYDCVLKADLKEIPCDELVKFTQTKLNEQDYESVNDMINELKRRGHKVTIDGN